MVGFEYKYLTSREILNNFKLIMEYSTTEYVYLIVSIITIFSIIYYIIPTINIFLNYKKLQKEKFNRKKFIRQIALQKDINDEIEKELNIS
jgi:hypothetical protein